MVKHISQLTSRGAASRERILRCALSLFALRGYDGVRVDEIARKAQCNKALLYYHFPSKQALYQEIIQEVFEEVFNSIKPILNQPISPIEKLRGALSVFIDKYAVKRDFSQLMVREILTKVRNIPDSTRDIMKGVFYKFKTVIDEGQQNGTIIRKDPTLIYRFLIGSLIASILTQPLPQILLKLSESDAAEAQKRQKEVLLDILMRGIQNG